MSFEKKDKYTIEDLLEIMKILRAPGGCPWDREQDHHSIRASFIEETYEAVEAIDTDNTELLKEELGDVLLQVVFHSRIEEEAGRFNFDDVADGICKKMIVRHPHVFGDVTVENSADVLKNWDEIKKKTKSQKTQTEVLQSVSPALPALMRSAKVQHKAAKVGFDWENAQGALEKVHKFQVALPREAKREDFPFDCLSFEATGRVAQFIARAYREEFLQKIAPLSPLFVEEIPVDFEELFLCEVKARGYLQ